MKRAQAAKSSFCAESPSGAEASARCPLGSISASLALVLVFSLFLSPSLSPSVAPRPRRSQTGNGWPTHLRGQPLGRRGLRAQKRGCQPGNGRGRGSGGGRGGSGRRTDETEAHGGGVGRRRHGVAGTDPRKLARASLTAGSWVVRETAGCPRASCCAGAEGGGRGGGGCWG